MTLIEKSQRYEKKKRMESKARKARVLKFRGRRRWPNAKAQPYEVFKDHAGNEYTRMSNGAIIRGNLVKGRR